MEYKVLYRKYRPQDFDSVVGQEYTTSLLKNAINENKISHAYIFTGPRGTGKTSSAKIFAKAINCTNSKNGNPCNTCDNCKNIGNNPDIIEIDAASNNGVDDIRELIENSRLAPSNSKYKVYIIDEFHMLSTSAFNALLLTLEEPPSNVVFILATTDIQSVPITVLSRCQRFDFKPITIDTIINRLKYVCKEEKIKISDEALKEIAYMSNGGLRDALSILDQISTKDGKIDAEDIVSNFGSISTKKIDAFINSMDNNNVEEIINSINNFKTNGVDFRIFVNKLIDSLKNILINIRLNESKYNLNYDDIYNLIFDLSNCLANTRNSIDPYIFIKIIILKYFPGNNSNVSRETLKENNDLKDDIKNNINESSNSEENIHNKDEKNTLINIKNTNKCSFDTGIRINNCFANAKKEFLSKIKEKWQDFLIYESNANKELMSYILDTEIVVASDKYAILTNKLDSTVELINKHINSLEQDFKIFYNMEYKFVCLSIENWKINQEKYIYNLKNHINYSIIEESDEVSQNPLDNENVDELEKLAAEIFDNNVEIK